VLYTLPPPVIHPATLDPGLRRSNTARRDLEALHDPDADPHHQDARERLAGILAEASERRETLERQLGMADEFISQLCRQLGGRPAAGWQRAPA